MAGRHNGQVCERLAVVRRLLTGPLKKSSRADRRMQDCSRYASGRGGWERRSVTAAQDHRLSGLREQASDRCDAEL